MPAPLNINFGGPKSMPQSIPGAPPPSPTGMVAPPPGALPDLGQLPQAGGGLPAGISPELLASLAGGAGGPGGQAGPQPVISPVDGSPQFPPVQRGPGDMQYDAITQEDGSVLIRLKNVDGTPGPIVEIIRAPKGKGATAKK